MLDTLLRDFFVDELRVITGLHRKGKRLDLDEYTVRVAFVIAPIWSAYKEFWVQKGDKILRTYGRHPSTHAVSRVQYSRTSAVLALMLVTSLLWLVERQGKV
jgi:hypothetical protein